MPAQGGRHRCTITPGPGTDRPRPSGARCRWTSASAGETNSGDAGYSRKRSQLAARRRPPVAVAASESRSRSERLGRNATPQHHRVDSTTLALPYRGDEPGCPLGWPLGGVGAVPWNLQAKIAEAGSSRRRSASSAAVASLQHCLKSRRFSFLQAFGIRAFNRHLTACRAPPHPSRRYRALLGHARDFSPYSARLRQWPR